VSCGRSTRTSGSGTADRSRSLPNGQESASCSGSVRWTSKRPCSSTAGSWAGRCIYRVAPDGKVDAASADLTDPADLGYDAMRTWTTPCPPWGSSGDPARGADTHAT
jgi:hypothetical protein